MYKGRAVSQYMEISRDDRFLIQWVFCSQLELWDAPCKCVNPNRIRGTM
jgi:hypothetical protein